MFLNNMINYDRYINRSFNKQNDDFEFGMIYYGFGVKELNQLEKLNNIKKLWI